MESFGCTECGLCSDVCSMSVIRGEKYSPYEKLLSASKIMAGEEKPSDITNIYQCTKCRACEDACPERIEITSIIDDARKEYVRKRGVKFGAQRVLIKNTFQHGTPFGKAGSRILFDKECGNDMLGTILFIGCFSSYVNKDIAMASVNILEKLGLKFRCLGEMEPCCGYFIFNTGDHSSANAIVEKNKKLFNQKGVKRIITVCPGCSTFLTKYYQMDVEVIHISKLISDAIENRTIPLKKRNGTVTFHDACNIGRSLGLYQEPRRMINALGYELVEMDLSKERALCCGADGGMKIAFPGLAIEIGKARLNGMPEGCGRLLTVCPFCLANFEEASNKYKKGIEILSLLVEFSNALL